jgi:hypothetical protein
VIGALERVIPAGGGVLYGLALGPGVVRSFPLDGPRAAEAFGRVAAARGLNAYFSLFRFSGPPVRGKGGRVADKALRARALFLDIDVGKPSTPYRTTAEALEAFAAMVAEADLPDPMVVLSGKGLHVYWPLAEDVGKGTWLLLQRALGAACAKAGLAIDGQRLLDPTTCPRVPGSVNANHGLPVRLASTGEVTPALELAARLRRYAGPVRPSIPAGPSNAGPPETAAPRSMPLIRECGQLRHAATPEASRATWLLMLGVLRYLGDGREASHALGSMDRARYSRRDTDEAIGSLTGGPPKCATFQAENPVPCAGCRWAGRISTPVEAARRLAEAESAAEAAGGPAEPPPPGAQPYQDEDYVVVPGRGVVWNNRTTENGQRVTRPVLINDNEFYIDGLQVEREGNQQKLYVRMRVRRPRSGLETVYLSVDDHGSDADMKKWLFNHRLKPVKHGHLGRMVEFMNSYLARLQDSLPITERKSRFGWSRYKAAGRDEVRRGFVVGDVMYTPDGPTRVALDDRSAKMAARELQTAGDLETWKLIPRMYRVLDQKEAQLFMCAAFAAPLMRTGAGVAENLVLSMWDSKGGKGKSTLLRAVNTVWGHPKNLTCSKTDTLSARYQTLGVRRNLPMCMDELTNMPDEDMSSFLYDVANGMEKRKSMSSGTALADTGQWETVTMITSNRSVHELMRSRSAQTTAETMRVVEVECRFANHARTELGGYVEDCAALMDLHHGHAGRVFIDHCVRSPGLLEAFAGRVRDWDAKARRSAHERFWTYGLGVILEAGRVAVSLGLLDYDMAALEAWVLKDLLPELRKSVGLAHIPAVSLLADFLGGRVADTLVVKSANRPVSTPATDDPLLDPYVRRMPGRNLHARLELEDELLYVSARVLDEWCALRRVSPRELLRELVEDGVCAPPGQKEKYNLAKGVRTLGAKGPALCYRFIAARDGPLGDLSPAYDDDG